MDQADHDKLVKAHEVLWRDCDLKADTDALREENELLRVEGTEESRAELDDALAQVVEERARRIKAEAELAACQRALQAVVQAVQDEFEERAAVVAIGGQEKP